MKITRLTQTVGLVLQRGARARGRYLKKKNIFSYVGENVSYQPRIIPLYPELIRLHDNIMVGAGVRFITHDMAHTVLNRINKEQFKEAVGCIEIMDNVFIGYNAIILPNVLIGENVIVGAGAVVTHDLPPNGVYAGVPAKRIQSFDDFVEHRLRLSQCEKGAPCVENNQLITEQEIETAWTAFYKNKGGADC